MNFYPANLVPCGGLRDGLFYAKSYGRLTHSTMTLCLESKGRSLAVEKQGFYPRYRWKNIDLSKEPGSLKGEFWKIAIVPFLHREVLSRYTSKFARYFAGGSNKK